ncbi:sensor histidine kinase [Planctomycetota bacterium]
MTQDHLYSFTEAALRERVKELTCLYDIAQIAARPNISLKAILQEIIDILPHAWQYPDVTHAQILLDGANYTTLGFHEGGEKLKSNIVVGGVIRGSVEVTYIEEKPELDLGPFLKEEQNLINAVARQVALIIENKQAEEEKTKLQDQLLHADRLATIGMLAAGVAHELNEPLGNILGFAQLAKKGKDIPTQTKQDIEKIEAASLYARQIIQNLLIFARQKPPQKTRINLNQVVENGLSFLEARCAKDGIELIRDLYPDMPEITADSSQFNQLLVNLVVNAIQAMPDGGKLTLKTSAFSSHISLIVKDTGIGMSEDVIKRIFMPFYTTKDVGQGTGLGLPVVHGIVTAHGGTIDVKSRIGLGSKFDICIPITESHQEQENDDEVGFDSK